MLDTEIEGKILSRTKWFSEDMPISTDLILGYMIGLLEEKAQRILSGHTLYRWTEEQKKEYLKTARWMIRDKINAVRTKIQIEQSR